MVQIPTRIFMSLFLSSNENANLGASKDFVFYKFLYLAAGILATSSFRVDLVVEELTPNDGLGLTIVEPDP